MIIERISESVESIKASPAAAAKTISSSSLRTLSYSEANELMGYSANTAVKNKECKEKSGFPASFSGVQYKFGKRIAGFPVLC